MSGAGGDAGANQDEIISVYEVFVMGDPPEPQAEFKSDASAVSFVLASSLAAADPQALPLPPPPPLPSSSLLPPPLPIPPSPPPPPAAPQYHHQLIQEDANLDLDAIGIVDAAGHSGEAIPDAHTLDRQVDNEPTELEISQSSPKDLRENATVQESSDPLSGSTSQIIDKDDPRSRLHYVKYLKRDGKTLKIWECGICSKEFRHQYTLMRHLPTHTDERNFKCEACGKAFRQLSTLSQHKAIHSDARPYVCEFCKKTFNRVSTLISHRKTHSENKPHKCHLCGKGFHQKGNLRNHVFTHTNERPYKCDICGKGFNQMSNLVCHKAKAHTQNEKMKYPCSVCGKEFPRRYSLRSHEEYKHGIKYRQPTGTDNTSNDKSSESSCNLQADHMSEDEQQTSDLRDRDLNMTEFMENIIIDKIETKAMEAALLQGQTPFALFKPAKGIPVLVKVTPSGQFNHLLTPATAEDLKVSGKMDSSATQLSDIDGSKSVQIKVPVVATVTEKIETDGKISFLIEPPGPDQEQESLLTPVESIPEMLPCEVDDFPPEEGLMSQQSSAGAMVASGRTGEELLELAALGDIKFVRPTVDGRYEVVTNSEARDLMAQNSHDVEILDPEEINSVIGVHGNIDYVPAVPPQHLQLRPQPAEIMVPSLSDFIMLDPVTDQKAQSFADIDALGDKEELKQLLDIPPLDDRYVADAITLTGGHYLSQAKIDEILNARSMDVKTIVLDENETKNNCNQLTSVLNTRNEISTIMTSSLYNRNPQPHYSLSILQDQIPYLKNSQNFNDDFNAIFEEESPSVDYSVLPECSRLKLPEFEDDLESILFPYS